MTNATSAVFTSGTLEDLMATPNNTLETLLTEHEVAKLLKVSVSTVRRRRLFGRPPEFLKIGASVRYHADSVRRLMEDSKHKVGER